VAGITIALKWPLTSKIHHPHALRRGELKLARCGAFFYLCLRAAQKIVLIIAILFIDI
jgi:hypothetical protein